MISKSMKYVIVFLSITLITDNLYAQNLSNKNQKKMITSEELNNYRSFFNGLGSIYPTVSDVQIEKVNINGVNCYWFTPYGSQTDKIIIYLHGGSFALGSIESHKAMVSHFADTFKIKILFVEYGLAPEHPFPAGINDVRKVYNSLITKNPLSKIILIGDSAGCGILVSTIAKLQTSKKQPDGVIMISPWLDLECTNASYEQNKMKDPILTKEDLNRFALVYASKKNLDANPSKLNFKNFPPVLILVGSNEILLDDSRNFISKIREIQGNSKFSVYENQNHVWLLTNIDTEESKKALEEMNQFISRIK